MATKLDVQRVRGDNLHRARLVDRLESAAVGSVVLVSAPAGYGKSSLVADWATVTNRQVAWVSLDSGDNDLARFWRYVAAAVARASPRVADRVRALLDRPGMTTGEALIALLVDAIRDDPRSVTLVLDDYHVIESGEIHESVASLLAQRPEGLTVVLCSRRDPPLPVPRLRADGRLVELRVDDLRFSGDEVASVLLRSWGLDLSAESVAALEARTEGWAVGLQFAAVALRGARDMEATVRAFAGTHRFVLDYLSDEVLDRQSDEVREFLLRCSILDRLSGPLCDAVLARSDSQQMLEHLDQVNLFVIPLDDQRRWYRFHHLFADLLRNRLSRSDAESVPDLHRRAARWCEQHDLPDPSIRHALAAGDAVWAARLIERYVDELLMRSEGATMLRQISALPPELVSFRMRIAQARLSMYEGQVERTERLLEAAESAPGRDDPDPVEPSRGRAASPLANPAAIHASLRAFVSNLRGEPEGAVKHANEALTKIRPDEWALHWITEVNLAVADWLAGRLERAEDAMSANLATSLATDEPLRIAWSCHHLGRIQRDRGRLSAAVATYQRVLDHCESDGKPPDAPTGVANVGLAAVAYQRNENDDARFYAAEGIELCRRYVHTTALTSGLATLAMIRQADGDSVGAMEAIDDAIRATDPAVVELVNPATSVRVRLLLANGELTEAAQWAEQRGLSPDDEPSFPREPAYLALARILLAQREADRALGLLDRLRAVAAAQNRTGSLIEMDALRALALQAIGDESRAIEILAGALESASHEQYVRVFVDEGPAMAGLLRRMVRLPQHSRPARLSLPVQDYANHVLRAFRPVAGVAASAPAPGLSGALTARELDVLGLIATGKRNQEIAAELFVTLDTVKKHVSHIYTKLGVSSRTEALAVARELDVIP